MSDHCRDCGAEIEPEHTGVPVTADELVRVSNERHRLRRQLEERDKRIAELEAELQDVKTLDEWTGDIESRWWCTRTVNEAPICCLFATEASDLAVCVRTGPTPAAARHAAAEWIRGQG